MGSMPLALSVHNFISSVGADAGFASIIGLAILVLLYFAHAKDTANLQDEAEELSHRLLQAEARIAQLSAQQPAAPAPAPAPASQAARARSGSSIRVARAGATAAVPAAPMGVGAPALAAATRVVPVVTPAPPASPAQPAAPARVPAPGSEDQPVAEPVFAEDSESAEQERELAAAQGGRAMAASAPVRERSVGPVAPATAAGGANGGGREGNVAAPVAPPRSDPPRPPVPIRSGAAPAARRPSLPPRSPARRQGGPGRRFALLIGALLALAAIAVLVVVTQSGGSSPSHAKASSTTNAPAPGRHKATPAFSPASVTVAVLNGTATNDLAHRVYAKLAAQGYKQGTLATASSQTQTATIVAFRSGFRNDALHVATALKLGPASVQPIDSTTQAVACPPPSACTANVVVTVGQDLATL
jgi:hypothetical protein